MYKLFKTISIPDLIECLNPIMNMPKDYWDYFIEEWNLYCK
jgi:hypothetical protein